LKKGKNKNSPRGKEEAKSPGGNVKSALDFK